MSRDIDKFAESLEKGARVVVTGRLDQRTWETNDGDKRSKIEIVADEVGPSLRWATTVVSRNERSDSSPSAAPGGGKQYARDEEPFVVDAADWEPGVYGTYPERMLP